MFKDSHLKDISRFFNKKQYTNHSYIGKQILWASKHHWSAILFPGVKESVNKSSKSNQAWEKKSKIFYSFLKWPEFSDSNQNILFYHFHILKVTN